MRMRFIVPLAEPFTVQMTKEQVTPQVTPQVKMLLGSLVGKMSREELQAALQLQDRKSFRELYLAPALEEGLIAMTVPDKPNSCLQKYRLTAKGTAILAGQVHPETGQ